MKINNKSFEQFRASVVRFAPASLVIDNHITIPESGYIPIQGLRTLEAPKRELVIDFVNEADVSDFTVEIMNESILDLEDGFFYRVWLSEQPVITQEGVHAFTATYGLYTIKQKEDIVIANMKEYSIEGNVESGLRLELTALEDVEHFVWNDIEVKHLKGQDTLVIDGRDKLIYYTSDPSKSAFDSVVLTAFPKAIPGTHSIDTTHEDVAYKMIYAPTYL